MVEHGGRITRRRRVRDRLATLCVQGAGATVLVAIMLMFAYLVYICVPLMARASIEDKAENTPTGDGFYAVRDTDGSLWRLGLPPHEEKASQTSRVLTSGNRALLAFDHALHFFDLVSEEPDAQGIAIPDARWQRSLALESSVAGPIAFDSRAGEVIVAYVDADGALRAHRLRPGQTPASPVRSWRVAASPTVDGRLLVDVASAQVLLSAGDRFVRWQLPAVGSRAEALLFGGQLAGLGRHTTAVAWGPGRESVLVATGEGDLHRYDAARPGLPHLGFVGNFGAPVFWMESEGHRRISALLSDRGEFTLFVPFTGEVLLRRVLTEFEPEGVSGLSADGSTLYNITAGRIQRWRLDTRSPDTGWRSLWGAHRYAAYEEPAHVWQPGGAAIGALPKYGLSPLLWGTFKAALYGMLIAVPLALGAAIYTGYFLAPRRRNQIKPAVEMLEAFPTVVLGFIAGLWLAPLLGDYLFVVLVAPLVLVFLPLLLAGIHLGLQRVSPRFVGRPLRLPITLAAYAAGAFLLLTQGAALEAYLFRGPVEDWFWRVLGLRYDQRNALLVGLAMGLAITPVMFSIVEDAINAVPRSLSDGSLALGATRWQSLSRVVLPAASPAVLSALLIGLARGLGETMIVLLASGNAPLMAADPFSGLRSLAANIAIELPEADLGGVHFRLLFLSALVLFILTFTLNTVAEIFRQRLRYAYAGR